MKKPSLRERVAIRYLAYMSGWKIDEARRWWKTMPEWEQEFYLHDAAKFIVMVRAEGGKK